MNTTSKTEVLSAAITEALPRHLALYYGGEWHEPNGGFRPTVNPATQDVLAQAPEANAADVDAAVRAAHEGFLAWQRIAPAEKSTRLREIARPWKS